MVRKPLPLLHRGFTGLAPLLLVALIGSRNLYYASTNLPPALDRALQAGLVAQTLAAILAMWADAVFLFALVTIGLPLLLFRRRWVFRREGAVWGVRPWLYALAWFVILLNNAFYEVNFYIAVTCALSLPFLLLGGSGRLGREAAAWAIFFSVALALAPDAADRFSVGAWALVVALLGRVGPRLLARADRFALALLLVPLAQVSSGVIAQEVDLHDGRKVGDGMAYAYCESTARGSVYAMVPNCGTSWSRIEECKDAVIELIDARNARAVERFRIFDDRYYGRIEEPVCLEDRIQVGMNRTMYHGERYLESVLEAEMKNPGKIRPHILGEAGGHRVLYDARDDALIYLGDDVPVVHRFFRKTGRLERWEKEGPASERIVSAAIDPARRSLFTVSLDGPVREFRLDDMSLVRTYSEGAGTEIAVDAERDRLLVTGFFGLEVIDIDTGRSIRRCRPGFLPRRPTLDPVNGLLYMSVFGAGKLLVMDRETLEPLKRIPIGIGGRYPYVTRDGRFLFAGSQKAHYVWSVAELDLSSSSRERTSR